MSAFTCHGCPSTWTGAGRAHCSSCHQTYSTANLFDRHRQNGRCLRPEDLDLIIDRGIWRAPAPENPWWESTTASEAA